MWLYNVLARRLVWRELGPSGASNLVNAAGLWFWTAMLVHATRQCTQKVQNQRWSMQWLLHFSLLYVLRVSSGISGTGVGGEELHWICTICIEFSFLASTTSYRIPTTATATATAEKWKMTAWDETQCRIPHQWAGILENFDLVVLRKFLITISNALVATRNTINSQRINWFLYCSCELIILKPLLTQLTPSRGQRITATHTLDQDWYDTVVLLKHRPSAISPLTLHPVTDYFSKNCMIFTLMWEC